MKIILIFLFIVVLAVACFSLNASSHDDKGYLAISAEARGPLLLSTSSSLNSPPEPSSNASSASLTLKNPSFEEVRDFIIKDPTSRNKFVLNQYECRHFATEVVNNALAEGLLCGFVLLCYDRGQHAVIAFNTTDRGLIYIEPQTDAAIEPVVAGDYQGKQIKEILIAW